VCRMRREHGNGIKGVTTEVQPISIVYLTGRGVWLALGKGNELGISGANGVW